MSQTTLPLPAVEAPPTHLSLGLPTKESQNDLDYYMSVMAVTDPMNVRSYLTPFIENMERTPEHYFNFGFNFADFKAYLLKLMFTRAIRKFIEGKRLQRIKEFEQSVNNPYLKLMFERSQQLTENGPTQLDYYQMGGMDMSAAGPTAMGGAGGYGNYNHMQ